MNSKYNHIWTKEEVQRLVYSRFQNENNNNDAINFIIEPVHIKIKLKDITHKDYAQASPIIFPSMKALANQIVTIIKLTLFMNGSIAFKIKEDNSLYYFNIDWVE